MQRLFLSLNYMKTIKISTDRILLIIIIVLLWCNTLIKACESDVNINPQPTVTMLENTVWSTKITKHSYIQL